MSDDQNAALHRLENENEMLKMVLKEAVENLIFYADRDNYKPSAEIDQLMERQRAAMRINRKWQETLINQDWGSRARRFFEVNTKWFIRFKIKSNRKGLDF